MADIDKVPVFDFMVVRAPDTVDPLALKHHYIQDTHLHQSPVLSTVWQKVFCGEQPSSERMLDLRDGLLSMLRPYTVHCPDSDPSDTREQLPFGALEKNAYLSVGDTYYLLPDRLESLDGVPVAPRLGRVLAVLAQYRTADPLSVHHLQAELDKVFDGTRPSTKDMMRCRRGLFDALYLLYMLRRWTSVSFEHIITGLRAANAMDAVAAGDVTTAAVLDAYLSATPVIHPIFARLFHYARPFNDIKPIGIGDLKVVKQWLVAYLPGEISDIHNVMAGETKERDHRRLEKTEETFSFSSEQQEETSKDQQSTDRFELKREAEQVIKQDINVNANLVGRYSPNPAVLIQVTAGFAFNRNEYRQDKTAQNFAHEVLSKAVSRVQSRAVTQRSVTKVFETEETNKHKFTAGNDHISGIYRWVDKRYKAQLFNYGKRMMFEFLVPEPAAFLVESRLRAFQTNLDVPQLPDLPTFEEVSLPFPATDIDQAKYNELALRYDLKDVPYPATDRTIAFINQESGQAFFEERGMQADDLWWSKTYECRVGAVGYQITRIRMNGSIYFIDAGPANPNWRDRNLFSIAVDGATLVQYDLTPVGYKAMYDFSGDHVYPNGGPHVLASESVHLTLGFQEIKWYALEIFADLELSPAAFADWQRAVYKKVWDSERMRVDHINQERQLAYDVRMTTYHNRLDELRATTINDLLQGQSEAANRQMILTELKRQCIALVAKEFDADASDDLLADWETMTPREVQANVARFRVQAGVSADPNTGRPASPTVAEFQHSTELMRYPSMMLQPAREKGRYVQFLEQAFDWQQLSYLCYPYFWATTPKWVQLLDRADATDPFLTDFLRAGYARVLLAVMPTYDDAVLHFLATREPWEGGPAPVIGDPLFIPLYEELRRQQDDRFNAVPESEPWTFTLPTSLVYLEGSTTPLPELPDDEP
ncbi:MAG TPA: hypothetical protein VFB84_12445 [Micromonosporaceae bacterium]|nr:hypothetical protein [Micromonosporaceae bacterium]